MKQQWVTNSINYKIWVFLPSKNAVLKFKTRGGFKLSVGGVPAFFSMKTLQLRTVTYIANMCNYSQMLGFSSFNYSLPFCEGKSSLTMDEDEVTPLDLFPWSAARKFSMVEWHTQQRPVLAFLKLNSAYCLGQIGGEQANSFYLISKKLKFLN